jgi:hypothetical protein
MLTGDTFPTDVDKLIVFWMRPFLLLFMTWYVIFALYVQPKIGWFLIALALGFAVAFLVWGQGLSPVDNRQLRIDAVLSIMLSLFLGIGLRYSARSFTRIAFFAVLIMAADVTISTVVRAIESAEHVSESAPREI